ERQMNLIIGRGNRFQGSTQVGGTDQVQSKGVEAGIRGAIDEMRRFPGAEAGLFARRISTEDFIKKLEEAQKAIVDAPNFDVAFQEKIRMDPLLASAFRSFIDMMMSNTVKATDVKKSDAQVIERRFQVIEFIELFKEKLEELRALRASTPIDLTQLGLEIMTR